MKSIFVAYHLTHKKEQREQDRFVDDLVDQIDPPQLAGNGVGPLVRHLAQEEDPYRCVDSRAQPQQQQCRIEAVINPLHGCLYLSQHRFTRLSLFISRMVCSNDAKRPRQSAEPFISLGFAPLRFHSTKSAEGLQAA